MSTMRYVTNKRQIIQAVETDPFFSTVYLIDEDDESGENGDVGGGGVEANLRALMKWIRMMVAPIAGE